MNSSIIAQQQVLCFKERYVSKDHSERESWDFMGKSRKKPRHPFIGHGVWDWTGIYPDYFFWWRCRDLNPGHCGYEPHALTN
jgi:hypothetical protein